jgi:hypothetical protein
MLSAAGKYNPVLVSVDRRKAGEAAVPSEPISIGPAAVNAPVTFKLVTVPPTIDAACQEDPFQTLSSFETVLKY